VRTARTTRDFRFNINFFKFSDSVRELFLDNCLEFYCFTVTDACDESILLLISQCVGDANVSVTAVGVVGWAWWRGRHTLSVEKQT